MEAAAREPVTATTTAGVTVVGSDAPSDYHIAPRSDNPTPNPNPAPAPAPVSTLLPSPQSAATALPAKKKRGRPRKYGPDGTVTKALSPKPISSAAPSPPVIDFSAEKQRKMKPPTCKSWLLILRNLLFVGEWVACSVGANFTPHIITINSGEDVTMKIISFSQQGPRAICIIFANGVISSVTLRQPDSSGGTLTYEGRFEILSLSGSFMPSDSGGTRSKSGGMSVSLASPDGRVVDGGVAGLLVAASPVQVVVGSFLVGNQHEQKPKKQKHETISMVSTPAAAVPISSADLKGNLSTSSSHGDSWSSLPSDSRNKPTDINAMFTAG
ncbi:hypothetical protein EZV62_022000 [Acer yangbiense]|uniref:AT-hook motif nuclear-localized protein n=1 Tax=Acer yangbiense TaxID=1000413 RepID=A0A5C7H7A5_9ROSI|nr:hypothetical protein EZV62_022000 [Acer yangbiense]